jgi:hypothetical protein
MQKSTAVDWTPKTWAQVRPLTRVVDDEKVIEIWSKVVTLYPGGVTEAKVKDVLDRVVERPTKARNLGAEREKIWRAIRHQFEAEYNQPLEYRRSFVEKGRELFQALSEELQAQAPLGVDCQNRPQPIAGGPDQRIVEPIG